MIKEGSLVKIVGRRPYDFMDIIVGQILKVDEIATNSRGEVYAELIASDSLIEKDSYLRYKGAIGFNLDELELIEYGIVFTRTIPHKTFFEEMRELNIS
jgi:hypothetical protein